MSSYLGDYGRLVGWSCHLIYGLLQRQSLVRPKHGLLLALSLDLRVKFPYYVCVLHGRLQYLLSLRPFYLYI